MKRLFGTKDFNHYYYAHRGLHDIDRGIPENSMAAFRAAAARGYGVELDVQLSRDGQVVVFHDDTLDRVCGVRGDVGDFTLQELREMRLLGTEETVPMFTEVLDILRQGAGPLIVELKTGRRNGELCEKTRDILRGYPGVYCVESFDPSIVRWFRKNAPEVIRGQLAQMPEDYRPAKNRFFVWMLGTCRFSFLNRPDFIAYKIGPRPGRVKRKRKKGILLVGWTSHDAEADAPENDAVIFEGCEPPLTYQQLPRN